MSGTRRDEHHDREVDRLLGSIDATVKGLGLAVERQARDIETIRDRQGRDVEKLRDDNQRLERVWVERLDKLTNVVDRLELTNKDMQDRMKESDKTISKLNEFRTRIFIGISIIGSALILFWELVGPAIQEFIKAIFGIRHTGP